MTPVNLSFVEIATSPGIPRRPAKEPKATSRIISQNMFQSDVQHAEYELRKMKDVLI